VGVSRGLIGVLFVVAGVLHFVVPDAYAAIVPRVLPSPRLLVLISGACEIAGGLGVLVPATRRLAGLGLLALLVAVLPANVQMLLDAHARGASAWWQLALVARLPLQVLLMWWVWRATQ